MGLVCRQGFLNVLALPSNLGIPFMCLSVPAMPLLQPWTAVTCYSMLPILYVHILFCLAYIYWKPWIYIIRANFSLIIWLILVFCLFIFLALLFNSEKSASCYFSYIYLICLILLYETTFLTSPVCYFVSVSSSHRPHLDLIPFCLAVLIDSCCSQPLSSTLLATLLGTDLWFQKFLEWNIKQWKKHGTIFMTSISDFFPN